MRENDRKWRNMIVNDRNERKDDETRGQEQKWKDMKGNALELTWNELEWKEMRGHERKWGDMRGNEEKFKEMNGKGRKWKTSYCFYLYNC